MLDFSEDLPAIVEGPPIFEAFSLPELVPAAVHASLTDALLLENLPPLEAMACGLPVAASAILTEQLLTLRDLFVAVPTLFCSRVGLASNQQ